jgi:YidC/Oxa1 family membrane protein insertase
MDRNSIIGFGLLLLLLVGYVAYNSNQQNKYLAQKRADSIAAAQVHPLPIADTTAALNKTADSAALALNDSIRQSLPKAFTGQESTLKLENKKVALAFTTKGAFPISAQIKNYQTFDKSPLFFFKGKGNELSFLIPGHESKSTADLYFEPAQTTDAAGSQLLSFTADLGNNQKIIFTYTLPADDYMLQCNIQTTGMPAANLQLHWQTNALHTEKDVAAERTSTQMHYRFTNKEHDYFTIRNEKKSFADPVQWLGFRTHYFSSVLICAEGFRKTDIDPSVQIDDSTIVARNNSLLDITPSGNGTAQNIHLNWYIGPNHYKTLKKYALGLDEMVPLGYGIFAFVKYINMWLIIPIFDFLSSFIGNYGIIIMLLTIFIRLILSFFTYKSYLSSAKMRLLKPELDELRAKFGGDQQKMGVEQMKLYRTAGVNPLGGCLPMLLQMPILFAMYYFFPSSIELRQKSFLWAQDLSTYDSILSWNTHIPLLSSVYGNHISLFTLLMTASSLFLALYNKNMTQGQDNPMMKYLPYIFPIMLLGVFNRMAAALTFYYFFSNLLSILQQFIIQKFIIDEQKIHAQIQEKRSKPAAPSKWQQRMEEIQRQQAERTKTIRKK